MRDCDTIAPVNVNPKGRPRNLVIVIGDQLDSDSAGFDGFDAEQDAVEWVELPNTLGMFQHADGGLMASKPYVATGKYIERMSNYCAGCGYDPGKRTGPSACPFTIHYWDFLLRHEKRLAKNQRMAMQLKHLARFKQADRLAIREHAVQIRHQCLSQ
jgi:deoxyribodipyrimidine photolyase-like uncharacterized protein